MKQNLYPRHIQEKLDQLTQQVEYLTEQVARSKDAIAGARQRLSGGFQSDQEFTDLRASLDQLVQDQPVLERKQRDAQYTLADCKAWLDGLPSDAVLDPVAPTNHADDLDLHSVLRRIDVVTDEIKRLRSVPVPGGDIEKQIKEYVATLARPRISGIAAGQQLRIDWPSDLPSLWAALQPDAMVAALMKEVDRLANTPLPLELRKKRIVELETEVDTLQRRALALGADVSTMPPPVIMGVRVVRQAKRAA